jgi:hypothetical protein
MINEETNRKIVKYIQDNIILSKEYIFISYYKKELLDDRYNHITDVNNHISFRGYYLLSLKQLKEIANILQIENIFIEHECDYDYDRTTYIRW